MIAFDPSEHQDKELYEIVGELDENGNYRTYLVLAEISFEQAAKVPWYFVVEEE